MKQTHNVGVKREELLRVSKRVLSFAAILTEHTGPAQSIFIGQKGLLSQREERAKE